MNNITGISCGPQEPLKFKGINGYETYPIDSNTIGIRPKWIKISDQLPETDQTVLCFIKGPIGFSFRVLMFISYTWSERGIEKQMPLFKDLERSFRKEDISFWMPLPEPPKDE